MVATTCTVPERVLDEIRAAAAKAATRSVLGTRREIVGLIVMHGTTATRFHELPNRARSASRFVLYGEDEALALDGLRGCERAFLVHTHPMLRANPSKADLRGAAVNWLDKPYGIFSVAADELHVHEIRRAPGGGRRNRTSEETTVAFGAGGEDTRSVTTFRATLPAVGTELQICPPGCTVDHDAAAATTQPVNRSAEPSRKEATTMAASSTQIALAEDIGELAVAKAYAGVRVQGKGTIARLYNRKDNAVAIYISGSALEGLPGSVKAKLAETRDGEASFTVATKDGVPLKTALAFGRNLLERLAK